MSLSWSATSELWQDRHPCRKLFPCRSLSYRDSDRCPAPTGQGIEGARVAETCQPLSLHFRGALVPPGWCLCFCPRPGVCLQAVCHPVAAESSGSVPRQSMAPRQDGVSPGTCFPPQPKLSFEQSKKEVQRPAAPGPPAEGLPQSRQEQEAEKQAALNKGTAPGSAGPAPAGFPCLPGAPGVLLGPCPCSLGGFSLAFRFTPQWASSPPGPSLQRRRRWCLWLACQGEALAAWPTGSALG